MQPGSRKRSLSDDQRLAKSWLPGPEQGHWGSHLKPVAAWSLLPVIRPQRLGYRHLRIAIMVLVDASEKKKPSIILLGVVLGFGLPGPSLH